MKNRFGKLFTKRTASYLLVACTAVLFYVVLINLSSILSVVGEGLSIISPLIWAAVIAYLTNPIVRFFEDRVFKKMKNRRSAHGLGVVLAILFVLLVISLIIGFIVPQLFESLTELVGNLEGYFNSVKSFLAEVVKRYPLLAIDVEEIIGSWSGLFGKLVGLVRDNLSNILNYSYQFGTGLFNVLLTIVMTIYILADRDRMVHWLVRLKKAIVPQKHMDSVEGFLSVSNKLILNFYSMNLIDAAIIGILNFVLMTVFGMKYSLIVSVVVAITNFIPTFGPIIGAIISVLLLVLVRPWHAVLFLMVFLVLQTLDPYVIKPILFKDGTGLTSLEVLLSVVICGKLFGMIGMIIGVPLFAILSYIFDRLIDARIKKKEQAEAEELTEEQAEQQATDEEVGVFDRIKKQLGSKKSK